MKPRILLLAMLMLSAIGALHANTTGEGVLDAIRADLGSVDRYRPVLVDGRVDLIDPANGDIICTVRELGSYSISISATVTRIPELTPSIVGRIENRIGWFNTTAPIGTLALDNLGTITLRHYLNPQLTTRDAIVSTIVRFAEVRGRQTRLFASMADASMR
jgi:hypothetical protein